MRIGKSKAIVLMMLCLSALLAGGLCQPEAESDASITPIKDLEEGAIPIGQEILDDLGGGIQIEKEGGLDTIDTTLLDELEQAPEATVSGLTVAVGSEPTGNLVFKPQKLDIKKGDTVT